MISLKRIRIQKNISQCDLARKLGVVQGTIANWESGSRNPNIDMIKKLAEALECSCDELLEDDDFGSNEENVEK